MEKSASENLFQKQLEAELTKKHADAKFSAMNEYINEYNQHWAPELRKLNSAKRYNEITKQLEDEYIIARKKKVKNFRNLWEQLHQKYRWGSIDQQLKKYYVQDEILNLRTKDSIMKPKWSDIFDKLKDEDQPGTYVQGSGHPCCAWYQRQEKFNWQSHNEPTISPADFAVTNFYQNWIDPLKCQLSFRVDGKVDDEYTPFYSSQLFYFTNFITPRRGRISLSYQLKIINAYLFAHGHNDFWWWQTDDYGFVGIHKYASLSRYRNGSFQSIYNTWNNRHQDLFYNSMWIPHEYLEDTGAGRSVANPGSIQEYASINVHDIYNYIHIGNNGKKIDVQPADRYYLSVGLLFWVQCFGDDENFAKVNIKSNFGNDSYIEPQPITVYFEECVD